jgi:hypothetical protein
VLPSTNQPGIGFYKEKSIIDGWTNQINPWDNGIRSKPHPGVFTAIGNKHQVSTCRWTVKGK